MDNWTKYLGFVGLRILAQEEKQDKKKAKNKNKKKNKKLLK